MGQHYPNYPFWINGYNRAAIGHSPGVLTHAMSPKVKAHLLAEGHRDTHSTWSAKKAAGALRTP
jgi:hypothetical protein